MITTVLTALASSILPVIPVQKQRGFGNGHGKLRDWLMRFAIQNASTDLGDRDLVCLRRRILRQPILDQARRPYDQDGSRQLQVHSQKLRENAVMSKKQTRAFYGT